MNRWKLAFWMCFLVLILTAVFSLYSIIDQGVTLTHQKEAYLDTVKDLDQLMEIINETNLSKTQISNKLLDHRLYEFMDFSSDTVSLNRVMLTFEEDKLLSVYKQW